MWSHSGWAFLAGPSSVLVREHAGDLENENMVWLLHWAGLAQPHQQRHEPLDPPEQRHVVDLDAAFGEQLLHVPVGQRES
jgi:hypothetical protein